MTEAQDAMLQQLVAHGGQSLITTPDLAVRTGGAVEATERLLRQLVGLGLVREHRVDEGRAWRASGEGFALGTVL